MSRPMTGRMTGRMIGRDQGSGTVLMVAVIGLAGALLGLVVAVGQVQVARHRAQAAADLAAISAATLQERARVGGTSGGRTFTGEATVEPCAAAATVSAAGGGTLVRCVTAAGGDVVVEVAVDAGGAGRAIGLARAGPQI